LNYENYSTTNSETFDRLYAVDANSGNELWDYTLGNQYRTSSNSWFSPTISDGLVYIGSVDNNIYALNALTGSRLWNYTNKVQVDSSPEVSNGTLYIGGAIGEDNASLYAFSVSPIIPSSIVGLKLLIAELIGISVAVVASVIVLAAIILRESLTIQVRTRPSLLLCCLGIVYKS
jgi:PQQ-like domain